MTKHAVQKIILAAGFALVFTATTISAQSDARQLWKSALSKCAISETGGKNPLDKKQVFLGIGNRSGPGSIHRLFPDGKFEPSRTFESYTPDTRGSLVIENAVFSCDGSNNSSTKISPSLGLDAIGLPIGGNLSIEIKKAKKITFGAKQVRWDNILIGQYEDMLTAFDGAIIAKRDLTQIGDGSRDFTLTKALLVKGFAATLEFDNAVGTAIQAKFPTELVQIPIPGTASVGLKYEWTGTTKLVISSDSEFYIAGVFHRYKNGHLATGLKRWELGGYSYDQLRHR